MNQQSDQQETENSWNKISKMIEELKMKERTKMEEILNEIVEKDNEIAALKKENHKLKLKMAKMESDLKAQNVSIRRRMPAELLNELFGSLPFENVFDLLAKMPNGLLARNVQKMINGIKIAMQNNKWNVGDCGPHLIISEDGLVVKHSADLDRDNSVLAKLPIASFNLHTKKPSIAFYYEVKILNLAIDNVIAIGFCYKEFQLQLDWLGGEKNSYSIGIVGTGTIFIDGKETKLGNSDEYFGDDDIVGIGLIHQPNSKMECFATCNGKLLGKIELPSKFATIQLFPAVTLYNADESILANFGSKEWSFIKNFGCVLE